MDENRRRYRNIIRKMDLQDESKINEALKRKGFYTGNGTYPLSSLHFELTSKCNAYCRHCYNNSGVNNQEDAMTPEKWKNFAKYLVEKGGVFECLLSGGEPLLLGESLFDMMDILNDDGTIFLVMTNGQLLTDEIAKKMKRYQYHWLQVSIDGASKEYHDSFRQMPGCWEKAVKGAAAVADNAIPLKIAHCVTPYNLKEIDSMCELANSLGASSIMIGGISLSGRTGQNRDLLLSKNDIDIMNKMINENREKYQGKMKVKSTNSVKQGLENHAKRPRSGAIIRPNGDIRIDGMMPFVIGNILKNDFTEIWESKIDDSWKDERVQKFISDFEEDDRNYKYVNYLENDIFI